MRKVTLDVCGAFVNGKGRTVGNTTTDGEALFLHGNKIAEKRDGKVYATLAGWGTVTTRERLNGLCELLGCAGRFHQNQHKQYYRNTRIAANDWIELSGSDA